MEIRSMGQAQETPPPNRERLEKEVNYREKAGLHLWHSIAMYMHTDENVLAAYEGRDQVIMDIENIMAIHVVCFICEEPFDPALMKRRCKGTPKGTLRYV